MSLPYAIAARLVYGKVFLDELEVTAYQNPQIINRLDNITARSDSAMPDDAEPEVTVILKSGERLSQVVDEPSGGPNSPLTDEKIVEKFRALAERRLDACRVQDIIDFTLDIDARTDVRGLPGLLGQVPGDAQI